MQASTSGAAAEKSPGYWWHGQAGAAADGASEAHELCPQSLEEYQRQTNRLQHLLAVLPGGVIVLDGDGIVEDCNHAAAEITGRALLGTRWRDVVVEIVTPRADDNFDLSLSNGRRVSVTTCSLGHEPGQILLINDVTETRALQDKVASVRRLSEMGSMLAAIAHQIRTPLSSALLYATGVQTFDDGETRAKVVERLRHLDSLVTDMLSFARQGSMQVEPVAIASLIEVFAACAIAAGIEQFEGPEPGNWSSLRVLANVDTLQSAFQNLVNNARQATEAEPLMVHVAVVERTAGSVQFHVRDNGPGIAVHLREQIFKPFVSSRPQGNGLGLPVARKMIESHGGTLTLAPDDGAGTRFVIELPCSDRRSNGGSAPQTSRVMTKDQHL